MNENILSSFELFGVKADENVYTYSSKDDYMEIKYDKGMPFNMTVKDDYYIVLDIKCLEPRSVGIYWYMLCDDGSYAAIKMGLLPQIKTRIALPFSTMAGKKLFLPRTPGKLKSVFEGQPIDYNDTTVFRLGIAQIDSAVRLEISYFGIMDKEPEYPVETKALVDEMGQKAVCSWKGKTKSVSEMADRMKDELVNPPKPALGDDMSTYGGCKKKKVCEGTGYFSLHKCGERWLLADPEGYEFFSTGLDCVNIDGDANITGIKCLAGELPEESPAWIHRKKGSEFFSWHVNNLYKVFGNEYYERWCDLTAQRMKKWGFNTIAAWSDLQLAEKYHIPHTYIMHGYPSSTKYIFRDFPDVYSPEFTESADEWAKQIIPHAELPELIGYFLGNEPNWAFVNGINIAAQTIAIEDSTYSRIELIKYMQTKYDDISELNKEWNMDYKSFDDMDKAVSIKNLNEKAKSDLMEFSCKMICEYIRIPSLTVKKYDPNHLNLGIRYAWLAGKYLASGSEYTDVFSFNCYSMDPYDAIENFSSLVGKPVMIGEFHFGALDRGLDATGIRGVTSQEERGAAFRYYMHRAASHPMCLGVHYFTLNDQAYLGRFDGENYQIGIVDVTQKPYEEFEKAVIQTNCEVYDIINGDLEPTTRKAKEIAPIFF